MSNETENQNPQAEYQKADAPFDSEDAELVLRSSDGVEFRITKLFITTASSTFATILGMPGLPPARGRKHTPSGTPIYEMNLEYNAIVLDTLLRFVHPCTLPIPPTDIDDACDIYRTAEKYEVDVLKEWAKDQIYSFIAEHPVAVFVMAYSREWADMAREAAQRSLAYPLHMLVPCHYRVLHFIPAHVLSGLWQYHRDCQYQMEIITDTHVIMSRVKAYIYDVLFTPPPPEDEEEEEEPVPGEQPFYTYGSKSHTCCSTSTHTQTKGEEVQELLELPIQIKAWWITFMNDVRESIRVAPNPEVVYEDIVYRNALTEAGRCLQCGRKAHEQLSAYASAYLYPALVNITFQTDINFNGASNYKQMLTGA